MAVRMAQLSTVDFGVLFDNIPQRREQPFQAELKKVLGTANNADFAPMVRRLCVVLAHVRAYMDPGGTIRNKVQEILGFREDNTYMDMFGHRSGSSGCMTPFDPDAEEPQKKYYLHPKAPALNLVERGLCQEYARHELKWADESDWPTWMQ